MRILKNSMDGRLVVSGQLREKIFARPHLDGKNLGMVAQVYHLSFGREHKIGEL
jgi:hypothetical protein